jgi:hypothetical protein
MSARAAKRPLAENTSSISILNQRHVSTERLEPNAGATRTCQSVRPQPSVNPSERASSSSRHARALRRTQIKVRDPACLLWREPSPVVSRRFKVQVLARSESSRRHHTRSRASTSHTRVQHSFKGCPRPLEARAPRKAKTTRMGSAAQMTRSWSERVGPEHGSYTLVGFDTRLGSTSGDHVASQGDQIARMEGSRSCSGHVLRLAGCFFEVGERLENGWRLAGDCLRVCAGVHTAVSSRERAKCKRDAAEDARSREIEAIEQREISWRPLPSRPRRRG